MRQIYETREWMRPRTQLFCDVYVASDKVNQQITRSNGGQMSHGIGPWIEADVPGFAVAYVRAANDATAAEFYG